MTSINLTSLPEASGNRVSGGLRDGYYYSPLPEHGTIRLLRLMPNQHEEAPLQCELFEYPMRKARQGLHMYEALSYVWGSEEDQKPIYVRTDEKGANSSLSSSTGKTCRLLVTANLHAALSHLRDGFLERIVWIDAICINQKDNIEKGLQVQFMAEIYANANRVVVWLGLATSDSGQAFDTLRSSARKRHTYDTRARQTQQRQAIFNLLERPWFQRIWVVQEAAAARHILMKCGPDEIDGSAFCSGLTSLNVSYNARPDLQGLIPPITYLIRDTIFRPRRATSPPEPSQPGTFSLNMHSLGELVDMYHARKATNLLDRIYALLGMSSDDPKTAGLLADYNLPWGGVFRKLIQFLLFDRVSVDTWDHCAVAVIQEKGHICGKVCEVDDDDTRGDVQRITIAWKNARGFFGEREEEVSQHTFRVSAQPIHVGDALCLLQGASKPMVVRFRGAYWAIIMITTPLAVAYEHINEETYEETCEGSDEETDEGTDQKWPKLKRSALAAPADFVMIWDWDVSQHGPQNRDYESFISCPGPSQRPWTESQDYLVKATRSWNSGILLNGLERYEDAWMCFEGAVKAYATALGDMYTSPGHDAWMADEEALMAMKDLLLIEEQDTPAEAGRFYNQPPLFWAAKKGHGGLVKLLSDTGAAVDVETRNGCTPLFCAVAEGHENIIQLLLNKGALIDSPTNGHRTRVEWAAAQGFEGIVRWLLNNDTRLNLQYNRYRYDRALCVACGEGHDKIVQILIENGADVKSDQKHFGDPDDALWIASGRGHDKVVQILLENGADVNAADDDKPGALHAASSRGNDKIVQMLLEKGADVNAKRIYGTALHAASGGDSLKTVQILLEKGADVNALGGPYGNALGAACHWRREEIVQILLEWGADVDAQGYGRGKALQVASGGDCPNIVQMLLEKGADVNAQGGQYGNALQVASYEGHEENVRILLEWGADVNAHGGRFANALQAAATSVRGSDSIIHLLLERGADVNVQGGQLGSALQAASSSGYDSIVRILLERGADVNAQGGIYGTALQAASYKGHNKIVQLLLKEGANMDTQGGDYGNALEAATSGGHHGAIQTLLENGGKKLDRWQIYN